MVDVIDFDAWFAENTRDPIKFKLLDQEWEIPGDIPAIVMLRLQRIERIVTSAVTDNDIPDDLSLEDISYESLTRMMIGDVLVDQWLEAGIKGAHLRHVTQRLMAIYQGRGEVAAGKAPGAKAKKQKRNKAPKLVAHSPS